MEALKQLRVKVGLSGYALARAAGLSTVAYYNLEGGNTKPTYDSLMSITNVLAEYLKSPPSEVLARLTGIDTPTPLEEAAS